MPNKRMIGVTLCGYLGLIQVAKITLARFSDSYEADRFYQIMRESDTDKTERIKQCLLDFFDDYLVFCIQKEEQEGPL